MRGFPVRRLVLAVFTVWGLTVLTFATVRILPGDAVDTRLAEANWVTPETLAAERAALGLDQPVPVQYVRWLGSALRGDFGTSFLSGREVLPLTLRRIPVSAELAVLALIFSLLIGLPIGILSATRRDSWPDFAGRFAAVAAISVPNFVLATLWILATSIWFRWQPPPGFRPFFEDPSVHLQQILPAAFAMGALGAGLVMRIARSAMLEVLGHDYVRTAQSKGLNERRVALRHAFPNALIPVISVVSTQFANLLGGAIIVETIFAVPGLGSQTVDALFNRDYAQLMLNVTLFGIAVTLVNLVTDYVYAMADPRIRISG